MFGKFALNVRFLRKRNCLNLVERTLMLSSQKCVNKTVLYDFHCKNGAKMVEFAEYLMPLMYGKVGVSASHQHVRSCCGLFDVSHMLQTRLFGPGRVSALESVCVADVEALKPDTGCLSVFTNSTGGIKDDFIVTNTSDDYLYVVSNAGCRGKVLKLLQDCVKSKRDVELEERRQDALLALQGPQAAAVLQEQCSAKLNQLVFMSSVQCDVSGIGGCRVTRCGYTGEDGFEIAVPADRAEHLCSALLSSNVAPVQLSGLAVRDSLRLEAGLCLYGNDITENTTPIEAGLTWTIAKRRRAQADFPGAEVILKQLKDKPTVRRAGIVSEGPPARSGAAVEDAHGNTLGQVCSGCPSPTLGHNVAMAYIPTEFAKPDTAVALRVRNKLVSARVVKMPFVPTNYYTSCT